MKNLNYADVSIPAQDDFRDMSPLNTSNRAGNIRSFERGD
jgi:hypothetical protein